jgi:hypothetical protein
MTVGVASDVAGCCSVVAARKPASHREQLDLRTLGDEALGPVQHARHVGGDSGGDGDTDPGPTMEVVVADLGDAHLEPAQLGNEWSDHCPLLLERVHVTEKDVELQPTDPHPTDGTG